MPVCTCKWCGSQFSATNLAENACSAHCSQMWRRESDRIRKAKKDGREYSINRDTSGRIVRTCARCGCRLSSWNKGHHCNPCWESMSIKQRKRFGRKGDAYEPEPDLRRERNELIEYGMYDDLRDESRDPAEGIDGGAG